MWATHSLWVGVPFKPRARGMQNIDSIYWTNQHINHISPRQSQHTFKNFNAPTWLQAYITKLGKMYIY